MVLIGKILILALDIYFWIIILSVVMSWLIVFDVINTRNPQAANLMALLNRATEPVYKPLRKFIPSLGGIDVTPIIIIIGISVLKNIVFSLFITPGFYY